MVQLHKQKAKKIKSVLTENIQRMQTRLDTVNEEYRQISDLGSEWLSIQKHSFALDAKVYTMESTLGQMDSERSQQQTFVKDVLDKLLTLVREMAEHTGEEGAALDNQVTAQDSQKRLGVRKTTLQHNRIELSPE